MLACPTTRNQFTHQFTILIQLSVCLRNGKFHLFHRRNVHDFVGNLSVLHPAVWAFNETIAVNPRMGRQTID